MRVRNRLSPRERFDLAISVDQELADWARGVVHRDLYRSKLAPYLLPRPGWGTRQDARRSILAARGHEARMAAKL